MTNDPFDDEGGASDEGNVSDEGGNPYEAGGSGERGNANRGSENQGGANHGGGDPFRTLRDQIRASTPVHPPSDPAADQRRRSAFVRLLLGQFTGQHYDDPADPTAGGGAAMGQDGSQPDGGEMLGVRRDFDLADTIRRVLSGSPGSPSTPIPWDRPLAATDGGDDFTMPSVLPTALPDGSSLPNGSTNNTEPWLAANAQGSNHAPAHDGLAGPHDPGSAGLAGIQEFISAPANLPTAMSAASIAKTGLASAAAGIDFANVDTAPPPTSATSTAAPDDAGQFASALPDDALSAQLAAPASSLPTGLPPSPPEAGSFGGDSPAFGEAARQDDAARDDAAPPTDDNSPSAAEAKPAGGDSTAARMTAGPGGGTAGAGSSSTGGSASGGGISISVEIWDLTGILNAVARAAVPSCRDAAREGTAALSAEIEAAVAQIKDITSRFDQHQMYDLMKSSQMRAIFG